MKDKRRAKRRTMRYSAWMAFDKDVQQGCAIADISETGARIDVEDVDNVPDRFILLLAASGSARRKCRVVWRQERQIGVVFEPSPATADKASLVPAMHANIKQPDPAQSE
jgi:hypothetical protein